MPPYRIIDLFCGAGGLTLGFRQNERDQEPGFEPVWANDYNAYAAETYNANFGAHCVEGDIVDLLNDPETVIPPADVVIGGPPCQGFSLLNKNREDDPRKQLWQQFLRIVDLSGADVFVMENVPQLRGSAEFRAIKQAARAMGFRVCDETLNSADYGAPQVRKRAFIIGCRFADPTDVFPPPTTHIRPNPGNLRLPLDEIALPEEDTRPTWRTVREAIGDLDEPVGTNVRPVAPPYNLHFHRNPAEISIRRYRAVPVGGNRFDLPADLLPPCWIRKTEGGTDLFGRMWWDKPSGTIRTEFFKPEKGRYLHPDQHRPITHREAARLQCFPDEFIFRGTKIEIAKQIGNAVPPPLGRAVAGCVRDLLAMRNAPAEQEHEEAEWPTHFPMRTAVA